MFKLEIELVLNDFNSLLRVSTNQRHDLSHVLSHLLVDLSLIRGLSHWTNRLKNDLVMLK